MTHRHNLGRSEKYHALPRTLYALLFADGGCYIGQSSNPQQRESSTGPVRAVGTAPSCSTC